MYAKPSSKDRSADTTYLPCQGVKSRSALFTVQAWAKPVRQHLPDSWPLIRFDLMLHKSANYYAIWRRFLHLNEYLRNLTPDTANATIDAYVWGLTEHLVQFLAEWIIMALEPARVITKVRAPDFLFLHDKDFWFKQIWVDLHQTMVLDWQGSYTRPVIGLVRCVCKDETEQTGRSSPIKMRICNLHFFAPIWMAQPIAHNFRRMSMADLKPRQLGFFDYKEGWYESDGKGKHEEEAFAGHTMGCIRLMITDNNVEPFYYHNWRPIEHFAAQGVIIFSPKLPCGPCDLVSHSEWERQKLTIYMNLGEARFAGETVRQSYLLRCRITNKNKNTTRPGQGPPRNPGSPKKYIK